MASELEYREQLRQVIAKRSVRVTPEMENYMDCQKCGAGLEWQYPGGVGDWRGTVTCERCLTVRRGVPHRSVVVPLRALQRGIPETQEAAEEEAAQQRYIADIAAASDFR